MALIAAFSMSSFQPRPRVSEWIRAWSGNPFGDTPERKSEMVSNLHTVAIVGFRPREVQRIEREIRARNLNVCLISAGHISDGSNAAREAGYAIAKADFVLWRPEGHRYFQRGDCRACILRAKGASDAVRQLADELRKKPPDT